MKKFITLIAFVTTINLCSSQIVSIHIGENFSNLKWKNDFEIPGYTEKLNGKNIFLNIDYWNKKYFNLSGSLGFISKSGSNLYKYYRENYGYITTSSESNLSYLSVNSTLNFKYPIWKFIPFINGGPRIDYLISNKNKSSRMGIINSTIVGLTAGAGLKYCISSIQIGLQYDHHINFNKVAQLPKRPTYHGFYSESEVYEKVRLLKITIGYRFK